MPRRAATARRLPPASLAALALTCALAPAPARGGERPGEYDVKAAMLLNVLKFVEWPTPPQGAALRVCSLGAPRFAAALAAAAALAEGRPVVVVPGAAAAAGCQVALLGPDEDDGLEATARRLAAAGALTVSDADGFAARGVMVNFVLDGDRVRFEVNLEAARQGGFRVSSKLLRLARVVGEGA